MGVTQPEDDSGKLTGKATNLEFCETTQFSNAVSLVFGTAQAKLNTFVGQISSTGTSVLPVMDELFYVLSGSALSSAP